MGKKRGVCVRHIREADPPGPPRDPAPHPVTGPVMTARPSPVVPVAAAPTTPAPAAPSTPAPRSAMERLRAAAPEPPAPRFVDMRPRYSGPERRQHQQDLGLDAFDRRQGAFKRPTPPLSSPAIPTAAASQSSPMERLRAARGAAAPVSAPAPVPQQGSYMERLRSIRGGPPTPRERGAHQAARQGLEAQGVRVEEPSPGTGTLGDRTAELRRVQRSLQQAQNVAPASVLGPRGLNVRMMGQGGVDEALGGYRFQRGRPSIDVADTSPDTTFHEGGHRVDHALRGGWGHGVNPQTGERYGGFATSDPEHPLAQFAQSLRQTPEHQAAVARVQKRYGPEMAEYYSSPEEVVARFHNWHVATEGARQRGEEPPPPPEDLEEYSPETLATHGAQYRDILGRAGDIARAQPRPPFERAGPVQVATPGYRGVREVDDVGPAPRPFGAENLEGGGYYQMRARHGPQDASPRNVTVYVRNNRVVAGPQHIVGARWSDLQAAHGYRQGAQVEGPFDEPPPGAFEHSLWAHHPAPQPLGVQTADAGLSRALDTSQPPLRQFGPERGYLEELRSPSGATMDEAVTDVAGKPRSFTPPHLRATERADRNYHDAMTDAYYDPGGLSSYSGAQRARVDELDAARRQAHAIGALHTPGGAGPYAGGNGHASVPLGDGHDGGGPPAPPPAGGQGAVRPPTRPGGAPAPSPTPGALPAPPVGHGDLSAYGSGLLASGPGAPEEPPAPASAASAAGPSLGPLARRPRFTPSTEE